MSYGSNIPDLFRRAAELCRQDSAWGEAGRHPGRAADQIRTRHQSQRPPGHSASKSHRPCSPVPMRSLNDTRGTLQVIRSHEPPRVHRSCSAARRSRGRWRRRRSRRERMRRIGVLMTIAADNSESLARLAALLQRLQELGWVDGRNMRMEYRWAARRRRRSSQGRVRAGCARARRHPRQWLRWGGTAAPGHTYAADRVRARSRSRSLPATSTAWRGRAETPPDSPATITVWAGNG